MGLSIPSYERSQSVKQLDPDQDQHSVGLDLDPNCLQNFYH